MWDIILSWSAYFCMSHPSSSIFLIEKKFIEFLGSNGRTDTPCIEDVYVDKIYVDQIGTPLSAGVTTAGGTNIGTNRHKKT